MNVDPGTNVDVALDDRIGRNNRIGTFAFQGNGLPAWHFQPLRQGGLPARSRLTAGRILKVDQTTLDVDVGGRVGRRLDARSGRFEPPVAAPAARMLIVVPLLAQLDGGRRFQWDGLAGLHFGSMAVDGSRFVELVENDGSRPWRCKSVPGLVTWT